VVHYSVNRKDVCIQTKLLTVEEVAKIMRVDPETVRVWIREKKLPAIKKFGRRWLISTLDIPSYKRIKGDKQ